MATKEMSVPPAIVVTGASTGIGESCALHLDKLGFSVFAGVRNETDGDALKQKATDKLKPVFIDVTDSNSIKTAANIVGAVVGDAGLAGLVNNAGIAVAGPLEFLPISDLRKQLEINVIGQISVTQAFLSLLRKGNGRIVNMGSINGRMASPFLGAYAASKFAIEALTDALRIELRPWGIPVSIIEPGSVATPIWGKSIRAADEMEANLPQNAHDLYDADFAAVRKMANKMARAGIPAVVVANVVTHALTSKKPKTRYVVGKDAGIQAALARFVPDRLRDWVIVKQIGLRNRA